MTVGRPKKIAILGGICALLLMGGASASAADTGGYPYAGKPCIWAPYAVTGSAANWCADYDWGDRHDDETAASVISPYGYYYRNCTDYAAWKLHTRGAQPAQYKGLGNAKNWATPPAKNKLAVNAQPAIGAVGVRTTGTYGHLAFVEAVHADGRISVSQYNKGANGNYSTQIGTPASLGLTHFVHFEVYQTPPPPPVIMHAAPPEEPSPPVEPVVQASVPYVEEAPSPPIPVAVQPVAETVAPASPPVVVQLAVAKEPEPVVQPPEPQPTAVPPPEQPAPKVESAVVETPDPEPAAPVASISTPDPPSVPESPTAKAVQVTPVASAPIASAAPVAPQVEVPPVALQPVAHKTGIADYWPLLYLLLAVAVRELSQGWKSVKVWHKLPSI